ncbi:MAG TPA: 30S ribosome-binding factor RbfA [Steroidobacteraceae bacterium]
MPRDPHRSRRIEAGLQRVLSELLRREINDPRVGSITITGVRVSPDLGHAKVFYLPFEETRDAKALQAGLDRAASFLRGLVGRELSLRVAPEIHFRPDEQLAAGMRLSALIDAAVADDEKRHLDDPDAPRDVPTK